MCKTKTLQRDICNDICNKMIVFVYFFIVLSDIIIFYDIILVYFDIIFLKKEHDELWVSLNVQESFYG